MAEAGFARPRQVLMGVPPVTVVVAYKWAANPQDASVGADGTVDWSRAKAAVSEYDPVAIEVGVRTAQALGVEAVGVSVGTAATATPMAKKSAMSRGLDRGLVVADDAVGTWNAAQVAAALAGLVARVPGADLVLTGDASIDENARLMSALVAGQLHWACFQDVVALSRAADGNRWLLTQSIPGGTRTVEAAGPLVVAVTTDAAVPRVPGMKDILSAGKKEVVEVPVADLDVAPVPVEVVGRTRPPAPHRRHELFSGDGAVDSLVTALRAEGAL
jgi:electron transfer flavoprotein beta subunit